MCIDADSRTLPAILAGNVQMKTCMKNINIQKMVDESDGGV